jgi:hypothetical protein
MVYIPPSDGSSIAAQAAAERAAQKAAETAAQKAAEKAAGKPAETAIVAEQPVVAPAAEPVDGSTAKGATDTPIDPIVDERTKFPDVKPGSKPTEVAAVQPLSGPDTVAPASLPPKLQESYGALSKRLNSNPQVDYIEIDNPEQNKGLSQFLNQFKEQLDSTPGLREKLAQTKAGKELLEVLENASKGGLSSEDILKLQTFIVSAGEDISHGNSATGIDGAFGPRTHQGLQNAFDKLLNKPDETIQAFDSNYTSASEKAAARQADYANMGGDIPSGGYSPQTRGVSGTGGAGADTAGIAPPPAGSAATNFGRSIADSVGRTRGVMAGRLAQLRRERGLPASSSSPYRCYEGVSRVLSGLNPPINLSGKSAYMAADQLRQLNDRFQEVKLTCPPDEATRNYLKSLPAGAVVVWGPSRNAAKRADNPDNGYSHGHISVALGNGYEFSDRDRPQITGTRDPERYGSVTVFLPKDA